MRLPRKKKATDEVNTQKQQSRIHQRDPIMEPVMEVGSYIQFVLALVFVIALILLFAYGAKKFGLMARVTVNSPKMKNKRLNIVEILTVDARRKLILIRRDNVEHLILSNADRDIVIEQNITTAPTTNRIENP